MTKFHVNPKTGNPGACRAESGNCPFGDESEHFDSKENAMKSYETQQEKIEHFVWKSTTPPTRGALVLSIYDPMSEEISKDELWGNKISNKFMNDAEKAKAKTRLVIENGQVWEKEESFSKDDNYWRMTGGPADFISGNFNHGDVRDFSYLNYMILMKGARLETGGKTPKIKEEHRVGYAPQAYEYVEEAESIKALFNKNVGAGSREELEADLQDHVAERWRELPPANWSSYADEIRKELGEPYNYGTDEDPNWAWKK